MKTTFIFVFCFLFFCNPTSAQETDGKDTVLVIKKSTEVRQARADEIVTTVDPRLLKQKNVTVRQADPAQVVAGTPASQLKVIKETAVRQANPSEVNQTTDPKLLKINNPPPAVKK